MSEYKRLLAQREALEAKIDAALTAERSAAIAQIKATIADFAITAADLGVGANHRDGTARRGVNTRGGRIKYRNSQTGDTWSGMGRPPAWIAGVADREKFRV